MVLVFDVRRHGFVYREVWFAYFPINVKGVHSVAFMSCRSKDRSGFSLADLF